MGGEYGKILEAMVSRRGLMHTGDYLVDVLLLIRVSFF